MGQPIDLLLFILIPNFVPPKIFPGSTVPQNSGLETVSLSAFSHVLAYISNWRHLANKMSRSRPLQMENDNFPRLQSTKFSDSILTNFLANLVYIFKYKNENAPSTQF